MDPLVRRDSAVIWHPATHFDDLELLPPVAIERAEGAWLHTPDGRRILDAIGSWWTSVHGHCHPRIVAAIADQVATLDHVMFAGFTHAPAVALAETLLARAPGDYARVFFADSGSDAVEIALKLAAQHHRAHGRPRTRFAALANGYHGETLGALGVCGSETYRRPFAALVKDAVMLPAPAFAEHGHGDLVGELGAAQAEAAVALLERHRHELAALVVEPLVQCAGKMAMTGVGYLRRVVEAAQELGIHVIADEIAVGLGRTGRVFASAWAEVSPDLVCIGKGLSGGALPLSAVLVRRGFDAAFRGPPERAFAHSHTFCANPIACAAALASMALLRETMTELPARIDALARARARVAEGRACVRAHRQCGTIVAFDLVDHARRIDDGRIGLALRRAALAAGVHLRPLGDTLYWMLPLAADDAVIEHLADTTGRVLDEVLG